MDGQEHGADGDHEHHDAEEDGTLVGHEQPRLRIPVIPNQPMHDKYAVVHTDTEDEGGDDDVDGQNQGEENENSTGEQ